jgi:hypothetical protein
MGAMIACALHHGDWFQRVVKEAIYIEKESPIYIEKESAIYIEKESLLYCN